MTHELLEIEHQRSEDFFKTYLGADVISSLALGNSNPTHMDEAMRNLLKQILIKFAELMPQADHVVRRDVNTAFSMYIGFQRPGGNQRGHYVDITANDYGFKFTISGSPAPERREALANLHESTRTLNNFVLSCGDSLENFSFVLSNVAAIYNSDIAKLKSGVRGWTPATCRANESNNTINKLAALQLVRTYFNLHSEDYTKEQKELLIQARDTILAPSIMQGLSVDRAFSSVVGDIN